MTKSIKTSLLIYIIAYCSVTHAESGIPYSVDSVGVVGPGYIRLFEPGSIMISNESEVFDSYFVISTRMIDTLQSAGESGCILSISSNNKSEAVSVLKQSCDQIIDQIRTAVELSNIQPDLE